MSRQERRGESKTPPTPAHICLHCEDNQSISQSISHSSLNRQVYHTSGSARLWWKHSDEHDISSLACLFFQTHRPVCAECGGRVKDIRCYWSALSMCSSEQRSERSEASASPARLQTSQFCKTTKSEQRISFFLSLSSRRCLLSAECQKTWWFGLKCCFDRHAHRRTRSDFLWALDSFVTTKTSENVSGCRWEYRLLWLQTVLSVWHHLPLHLLMLHLSCQTHSMNLISWRYILEENRG